MLSATNAIALILNMTTPPHVARDRSDHGTAAKIGSFVKYSAGPHLQGPVALGERAHSQVFGSSWNACQLQRVYVPLATGWSMHIHRVAGACSARSTIVREPAFMASQTAA
jgi:hypothetical protein